MEYRNRKKHGFLLAPVTVLWFTAAVGCARYSGGDPSASSATASEAGYIASATIRPVGETGQYKTEITIERTELDGSLTLMAEPWIVSSAGQPAVMTFESTCTPEDLRVEVDIPPAGAEDAQATVTVGIFDGEIVAAEPVLVLAMPE